MAITQRENDLCTVWDLVAHHIYGGTMNTEAVLGLGLDRVIELVPEVPVNMARIVELTEKGHQGDWKWSDRTAKAWAADAQEWIDGTDWKWTVTDFFNDYTDEGGE